VVVRRTRDVGAVSKAATLFGPAATELTVATFGIRHQHVVVRALETHTGTLATDGLNAVVVTLRGRANGHQA